MGKQLFSKFKESLFSVVPITALVIILSFFYHFDLWTYIAFIVGAILLIFGMTFFTLGSDMSMMPVGEGVGNYLTKKKKVWLLLVLSCVIGILITIAEPDLLVLSKQITMEGYGSFLLILAVGLGVGVFLMLAMLRIVLRVDLRIILAVCYILVFILASFVPDSFVPIAFDSGGVTTGPITVPFIMAFGLGIASARSSKDAQDDSFGFVALCSIGPILAVMILGLFVKMDVDHETAKVVMESANDFGQNFGSTLLKMVGEISLALCPIMVFVLIFELFLNKVKTKNKIKPFIGIAYTFLGLVLFLTGANFGFMPIASHLGNTIGGSSINEILIPLGMVMGFFVVMAEPAVHVLTKQVEDVTGGAISRRLMLFCMAIGVAISVGLAMLRVICDISIWWVIIPGYAIALIMAIFVPKIFTAIAFDSGGVASGPMTATFLLPLASSACAIIAPDKILHNGFGIVALVAMTPLIVIQMIGLVYRIKLNIAFKRLEFPVEDVIEFQLAPRYGGNV